MKKQILVLLALFAFVVQTKAQVEDYGLGNFNQQRPTNGGYYDYSDPTVVNIKVSVWGYAKYPGKYFIPAYSNVNDLLSFAGGPTVDARIEKLRLYRVDKDSNQVMVQFNYDDLLWGDSLTTVKAEVPKLKAGDILLVPGDKRYFFRDWFTLGLSIFSALISLGILILNISRK